MSTHNWAALIKQLENKGVIFDSGLTDAEIARAEEVYRICFPADLRAFLQTGLPNRFPFPNWRLENDPLVREMLRLPLEGILFDIEHGVWMPEWGPRPAQIEDAQRLIESLVGRAPRLIPLYLHRMMPDRPNEAGNPVLSVHQTDIIYYGFDLDDYFRHEFELEGRKEWPANLRSIEFWNVDGWQEARWN